MAAQNSDVPTLFLIHGKYGCDIGFGQFFRHGKNYHEFHSTSTLNRLVNRALWGDY